MELSNQLLDNYWTIVAQTEKQILIVKFMGETRGYLIDSFSPKTRDVYFNEVRGAQDITDFGVHLSFQISQLNPITLEDRIQSRPKKDFKFGHDDYMWLISNKKNEY